MNWLTVTPSLVKRTSTPHCTCEEFDGRVVRACAPKADSALRDACACTRARACSSMELLLGPNNQRTKQPLLAGHMLRQAVLASHTLQQPVLAGYLLQQVAAAMLQGACSSACIHMPVLVHARMHARTQDVCGKLVWKGQETLMLLAGSKTAGIKILRAFGVPPSALPRGVCPQALFYTVCPLTAGLHAPCWQGLA